jgi:hypothetical protein
MAVNYDKLGELIDGYGGISADDLSALPVLVDARDDEIALLKVENGRLRAALAEVELVLIGPARWLLGHNPERSGRL